MDIIKDLKVKMLRDGAYEFQCDNENIYIKEGGEGYTIRCDNGYLITEMRAERLDDRYVLKTRKFVRLGSTLKLVKESEEEVESE